MASTARGIVYPTSGDNVAPLETHFASLANSTDVALDDLAATITASVISGANGFTGPTASGSTVDVTVTFPSVFTSVPNVVCTVRGQSPTQAYVATIAGIPTVSGFTATVYKITGASAEALTLEWMAQ